MQRIFGLYSRYLTVLPYQYLHEHYAFAHWEVREWWQVVIVVLGVDLGYYWGVCNARLYLMSLHVRVVTAGL